MESRTDSSPDSVSVSRCLLLADYLRTNRSHQDGRVIINPHREKEREKERERKINRPTETEIEIETE